MLGDVGPRPFLFSERVCLCPSFCPPQSASVTVCPGDSEVSSHGEHGEQRVHETTHPSARCCPGTHDGPSPSLPEESRPVEIPGKSPKLCPTGSRPRGGERGATRGPTFHEQATRSHGFGISGACWVSSRTASSSRTATPSRRRGSPINEKTGVNPESRTPNADQSGFDVERPK